MATFHIDFFSNALNRIAPLTVILPIEKVNPQETEHPEGKDTFKTIYLLHGYSGSNNDWLNGTRIEFLARVFNAAVVMPAGENSFYLDDAVRAQYYERLICEEIVEFTRKVFPLSEKREDTTIAGLSMGGYGAMRNGLKHSCVFGNIFAFSSAFITDELEEMRPEDENPIAPYSYYRHVFGDLSKVKGSDIDPKALAAGIVENDKDRPKIFMACGSEDFLLEHNRDLHKYFESIGLEHEYRESPGTHSWAFWDEYIEKAMEWLYGSPAPPL